jgi:hypothetical protein
MVLPFMNPYWFLWTSCIITVCNLVDKSFVMHLSV